MTRREQHWGRAADSITEAEKKKKNDKGRPQSPDEKDKFDGLSDAAKIAYQARGTKKQRPAAAALDFSGEEESAGGVNGGSELPSKCSFCHREIGKKDDDHVRCSSCGRCVCMRDGELRCDSGRWLDETEIVCVDCDAYK